MNRPTYQGVLSVRMGKNERRAFNVYREIIQRCKRMGAQPPDFNSREFIGWWIENTQNFSGTTPTCGRLDHSKGYRWDNIEIQDNRDNAKEMAVRTKAGLRGKRMNQKTVLVLRDEKVHGSFCSIKAAAEFFGVSFSTVKRLLSGKTKNSPKVTFVLRCAQ